MDKVWEFMRKYQAENLRPPSLGEIAAAVDGLGYRSSAKYRVDQLIKSGLAMRLGPSGSARRVIAVAPTHKLPYEL